MTIFNLVYVLPKQALTIFNLEWRPLAGIQMLDCFGQFPQRTEQWNEHKLPWKFQSPPFLSFPCAMCTLSFLKHPCLYLTQCLYNFGSYYTLG